MNRLSPFSNADHDDYSRFLLEDERTLIYHSPEFKHFLEALLSCESQYLLARNEDGKIIGALPMMFSRAGRFGPVANSLPYYGSYGGIITSPGISNQSRESVRKELLHAADDNIRQKSCAASTIIISPFEQHSDTFESIIPHDLTDTRIGQITTLPEPGADLDKSLMQLFTGPRPRNIRKAMKSGISIDSRHDTKALDFLFELHCMNMRELGGLAKEKSFFEQIPLLFSQENYRVYIAEKEGQPIAALLLLYYNKTVEYYIPAINPDSRTFQPNALIVYTAMQDAVNSGYRYWNWGGTWLSQKEVYNFKKRWGTTDYPYKYYTKLNKPKLLHCSKEEILEEYPGFFVVPFSRLEREVDHE